jgi:hypothetical protein
VRAIVVATTVVVVAVAVVVAVTIVVVVVVLLLAYDGGQLVLKGGRGWVVLVISFVRLVSTIVVFLVVLGAVIFKVDDDATIVVFLVVLGAVIFKVDDDELCIDEVILLPRVPTAAAPRACVTLRPHTRVRALASRFVSAHPSHRATTRTILVPPDGPDGRGAPKSIRGEILRGLSHHRANNASHA